MFYSLTVFQCRSMGLPGWLSGKESAANEGDWGSIPGWGDPLEKEMATQLAWRIPWRRSLEACSPWGLKELDARKQLSMNACSVDA